MTRGQLMAAAVTGAAGVAAALFGRRGQGSTGAMSGHSDVFFSGTRVFDGERFLARVHDVLVDNGMISAVAPSLEAPGGVRVHRGGTLFPGFVDAHVHLSFSDPRAVVSGGVTTVLDLGEPEEYAFAPHPPVHYRSAGPLVTAPHGYPTTSWGANGYGLEVATPSSARSAVAALADRGAVIIKVAIEPSGGPLLDAEVLSAVVAEARARRLRVAAHALGAQAVRTALEAGVDVLAHTPVEPLDRTVIRELGARGVAVISTVRAFGARSSTRANLAALAAAGCPVAYGTDLGNGSIRPGIDTDELAILAEALGHRDRALAAATSVAGSITGSGGRIAAGLPADLVWVRAFDSFGDLRRDPEVFVA